MPRVRFVATGAHQPAQPSIKPAQQTQRRFGGQASRVQRTSLEPGKVLSSKAHSQFHCHLSQARTIASCSVLLRWCIARVFAKQVADLSLLYPDLL
ncbi:MAG: hypothetical protein BJG00_006645 [Limnothrix sp. CACIAM 69d]|nr:MAG: hypothetical protein BJG00_006645 [Limnothrix sp. CACIAM 69d]